MNRQYRIDFHRLFRVISPAYIKKAFRYLKRHGMRQFLVRLTERFLPEKIDYETWFQAHKVTETELEKQKKEDHTKGPVFSILVPVYNTPEKFLREMIESVLGQSYPNWELCIADASPLISERIGKETCLTGILREYEEKDRRIRVRILGENHGISGNLNEALSFASGEYVGVLDHDDLLEPDLLYELAGKLREEDADLIYTDEDKINSDGSEHLLPNMKPDYNCDLLRSNNYICHFCAVKRSLAIEIGGFDPAFDGAQDYDFFLRCTEHAKNYAHVHRVLYHWRTHEKSTSDNPESKIYAFEAGKRALQAHLDRLGLHAEAEDTRDLGYYRVHYRVQGEPMVSILIPNKDQKDSLKKCLRSIWKRTRWQNYEILIVENNSTDPATFAYYKEIDGKNHVRVLYWKEKGFNYSAINNFAAENAAGEYYILLNNDTEIITDGWMTEMLGVCQRKEVGMVGAKLYFPDRTVQSAGTIIGMGGLADHAFVNMPAKQSGYMHRASIMMNLSGVTAACAMVKAEAYWKVGGMEEELSVAFNDVDLGLKLVTSGYLIVFDPYAEAFHYESKSRGASDERSSRHKKEVEFTQKKWAEFIEKGDPCYNRNLTLSDHNFSLR